MTLLTYIRSHRFTEATRERQLRCRELYSFLALQDTNEPLLERVFIFCEGEYSWRLATFRERYNAGVSAPKIECPPLGASTLTPFLFCNPGNTNTVVMSVASKLGAFDSRIPLGNLPPNCILFAEVRSTVHWMRPQDIELAVLENSHDKRLADIIPVGSNRGSQGCFFVCFCDGSVAALSKRIPVHVILPFFKVDSAQQADRKALLTYTEAY